MSARVRVYLFVATASVAAAGLALGITLATRTPTPTVQKPKGPPPLSLDFGVRSDPETAALERASKLYDAGKRDEARAIFSRYSSLEAQVGAAVAAWPAGTLHTLDGLSREHPGSALVRLYLGLARLWNGDGSGATAAFEAAARVQPDTPYAVQADSLLHPHFAPRLPQFTPSEPAPASLSKLPSAQQLAALARLARSGSVRYRLLYGATLQTLGRPVSAERQFALAAKAAPNDPEALTAADVGRFSKADPSAAFSRLGPLAKRFPKAATVRFHLGEMLVWMAQLTEARKQLRAAVRLDPHGVLGAEARRFLAGLQNVGTK